MVNTMTLLGQNSNTITSDNYVSQAFKGIFVDMPDYREVNSGSKLVVKYEGEWPAEMQGAFEYAVKIWEEVLPMTLPIRITAKIGNIRGSANVLSRVSFDTYDYNGRQVNQFASPMSMIKSVLLQEYHSSQRHRFYDEINDVSILEDNDITITYNINMINDCDFSLDGTPNENKYDFVTVVLRDIAIGLGFTTSFTADVNNNKFNITNGRLTPFESLVMNSLNTSDPFVAFTNATKGKVDISLQNWGGIIFDSLSLYAPTTWVNGKSLRFMIPNNNPISKLLTYDFGKGYIMRNLSGVDWDDVFCGALDWRRDLTTGSAAGSVSSIGTSNDILPYKGTVSLSFNRTDQNMFLRKEGVSEQQSHVIKALTDKGQLSNNPLNSTIISMNDYCKKYNAFSPDGPSSYPGVSLSVLKKDGSWDCIYKTYYSYEPITIDIENIKLNYSESEYARGTTGGLRYRLTQCTKHYDNLYGGTYHSYRIKYFTRDYTPQKANIRYIESYTIPKKAIKTETETLTQDDGFIDVKIGIANIEGTKKIVVEQLEEGETFPYQYEISDFRKGYFIANLDCECTTKITVICYNDNGFQRSNTLTIPARGLSNGELSFTRNKDNIRIDGIQDLNMNSNNIGYSITCLSQINKMVQSGRVSSNTIGIENLPNDLYILSVYNNSGLLGRFKFKK